jgi:hypothetical protein
MQYMISFWEPNEQVAVRTDPERSGPYWGAWGAYIGALRESGIVVTGYGLEPPPTGTLVRVRDGRRQVQDGPHPDSKENLGGFFVVDVPDLETALEWAARSPAASYGFSEVRPIMRPPAGAPVA